MDLPSDQLTILFNRLYDRGETTIEVAHPGDEIGTLARIDLDDWDDSTVRFPHDRDSYGNAVTAVARTHGNAVAGDLPSPRSFVNAAVAAGILPLANEADLATFLDRYGDPDLMAGHPPVFAGLDTNLLAWRIDEVLGLRDPESGIGTVNGFVLATGVRDELDWDDKCDDTHPFERAFGDRFAAYWNQPLGDVREGRLAHEQYRRIRDIERATEIESDPEDPGIISAYDDFQSDHRGRILLLSNDRNFVTRARDHTLTAHHVAFPDDLPDRTSASWAQLERLLYTLGVLFGVIELPAVTAHGVWRGKEGMDWQRERLRLDCRSPTIEPKLAADYTVVERYREVTGD